MAGVHVYDRFLRQDKLPHIWCSGCGNGIVTNALIRAIEKTGIDQNQIVIVAGVGCSSRANGLWPPYESRTSPGIRYGGQDGQSQTSCHRRYRRW